MTPTGRRITLIGEEVSGAWNDSALQDIAQVLGGEYLRYDAGAQSFADNEADPTLARFSYVIAAENTPDAESIYTFRPPAEIPIAVIVGNEAKGLRRRTRKLAHATVAIPLASGNINCLNVAAAAAIILTYLGMGTAHLPLSTRVRQTRGRRRPDLLLVGGSDHMELGSAIRSACAFGWDYVFLDDRNSVWYECERRIRSEGRGAARRGRNPIKVIPHREPYLHAYRRIVVFTTRPGHLAPWDVRLTGENLLAVLEDEGACASPWLPPPKWRGELTHVSLPTIAPALYHYRQMSSIAMAEIARQAGPPAGGPIYLRSRRDRYRREVAAQAGDLECDLGSLCTF